MNYFDSTNLYHNFGKGLFECWICWFSYLFNQFCYSFRIIIFTNSLILNIKNLN